MMRFPICLLFISIILDIHVMGFTTSVVPSGNRFNRQTVLPKSSPAIISPRIIVRPESPVSSLKLVTADLATVGLVAGQENYGFAIVTLIESIWSFSQAPSFDHDKVFVPTTVAATILILRSGLLITSGNADSIALGLEIATATSVLLGASYVARLVAPFSPSSKEIAFGGLLVALAGFFSFSQNLVVDGFIDVNIPQLPNIFPENQGGDL
mmetsp:Transcript_34129/g.34329  ORF Transcript_34129/g.34329 Transcript_34129/m.34329 type:complete len:211 (-) Transcript_34129:40-672(-)